ncbi:MAG: ABC transporter permease, partial [Acidimicrobiales bacterium]
LYGYVSLARRALTGGATIDPDAGELIAVPLWQPLTNVIGWTAFFAIIAVLLVGRGRARQ